MEKLLLDSDEVIRQYEKLKNIHKVSDVFGVSISPIKRILDEKGIIITNRRYSVDDNYFNIIDSEEKSYWLGFLYADGYIRERKSGNSLELKLSIKDKAHLELFRECVGSNHLIKEFTNKVKYKNGISESEICHLAIYSKKIVNSIKKHGMGSRKTFTIGSPPIEDKYLRHFIRGYFDGDGSFSYKYKEYSKTQIVSASKEFQTFIINTLNDIGIKINLYSEIKLQIQNKIDNLKFYHYIYDDSKIHLKRKKEKYEQFRKLFKQNS